MAEQIRDGNGENYQLKVNQDGSTNQNIVSREGNEMYISRFGQAIMAHRKDDVLIRFEYNLATYDITSIVSGTGSNSNLNSMAIIDTGSGVGTADLKSNRIVVYRPGHEIYIFQTLLWYGTYGINTQAYGGIIDDIDGFAFGYLNTTEFGLIYRNGGVDTFIAQSSWNKDKLNGTGKSGFNLDVTKLNQYRITYGWLGSSPITFSVYAGESLGWITCHVIDITNSQVTPITQSPSNALRVYAKRTSGSGAIGIKTASWEGGSTEGAHAHAGHKVFAGTTGATSITTGTTHLITFRNKSTFQNKINKVLAEAVLASASCEGTKPVQFQFRKNSTLSGGTWADIDTNNSIFEISKTVVPSGGIFEMSLDLGKTDSKIVDLGAGHIHLELFPGETMTINAVTTGNDEVNIGFRWEEFFS